MWQLRTAAVSEWSWKAPAYLGADTGTWQWWGSAAFLAGLRSRTGATSSAVGGTTTWQPKGWIWAEWEDFNARICAFPERTISSGVTPRWQRGFLQDLPSIYSIVHVSIWPWTMRAQGHEKQFKSCKSHRRASTVTNSRPAHRAQARKLTLLCTCKEWSCLYTNLAP